MSGQWYCRLNGKNRGPLSAAQVQQMVREGAVGPECPVRQGETGTWVRAGDVREFFSGGGGSKGPKGSSPPLLQAKRLTPRAAASPPSRKPPSAAGAQGAPAGGGPPVPAPAPAPAPAKPAPAKPAPAKPASPPVPPPTSVSSPNGAAPVAVAVAASPQSGQAASTAEQRYRRKSGNMMPVLVAVGVVGILALGVAVFAAIEFTRGLEEDTQSAAADDNDEPGDLSEGSPAETNASGDGDAANDPTGNSNRGGEDRSAPLDKNDPRAQVIASIDRWRPAKNTLGGLSTQKVRIDSVWLGSELRRDSRGPRREVSAAALDKSAETFVFVQLTIRNFTDDELRYFSWNGGGEQPQRTRAIMADDAGRIFEMVPYQEPRLDGRVRQATISAKGETSDLLVFKVTDDSFKHLKLALPFNTGDGGRRYYGLRIDREMLTDSTSPDHVARRDGDEPPRRGGGDVDPELAREAAALQKEIEDLKDELGQLREGKDDDGFETEPSPPAETEPRPNDPRDNGRQPDDITDLIKSIESDAEKKKDTEKKKDPQKKKDG